MSTADPSAALDHYLPGRLRHWLEQRYYVRIGEQAMLEQLRHDPEFWRAPERHVAFFGDHGVVHVRDVARRVLQVLDSIHGLLIPAREAGRVDGFMRGYAVLLAYLHDIGMVDFSAFGRHMHPEYAAQAVFAPELDELVAAVWGENVGNLAWRLLALARDGALDQPPERVLRELLALAFAHSKKKVPAAVLDDPAALRALAQASLSTELRELYRRQARATGDAGPPADPPGAAAANLSRMYADFAHESYRWLVAPRAELRALTADVIDTLRALRCADALRQRGTVQKTSASYEVYINQQTGHAECALRLSDDKLYLLELPDPMAAGEANLAGVELDRAGNLRISFHCGRFGRDEALRRAAQAAAHALNDIYADISGSFRRGAGAAPGDAMQILLEQVDDGPQFVALVTAELTALNPALAGQIQPTISLKEASARERARYLAAAELDWAPERRRALLAQLAQTGQNVLAVDLDAGFRHVRVAQVRPGETVIEAETPSAFVYVPLDDGLQILPLGGYTPFVVRALLPLGSTGVVRGAVRNATVVADRELALLIIPKATYLEHWHRPYTAAELRELLAPEGGQARPSASEMGP